MSTRDELANLIDDAAEWATSQGRICSPHEVADAILAAGYVKADSREWGVQRAPEFGSTVAEMHTRDEAESCARQWPGSTLVHRSAGHGPWEVA